MRYVFWILLIAVVIWCFNPFSADQVSVEKFVEQQNGARIGSAPDVWLTKGSFGLSDRVALIFGYLDDLDACQDIADGLNERFPAAKYRCERTNAP